MLVVKRLTSEVVRIGDNITVMVTDAGNGWAKLGITAPHDVKILREELVEREAQAHDD